MGRNLDPKCAQCRRIGEKLFLKGERCTTPKCAVIKKNYPPGVHGAKGRPRKSDYGLQLAEKQKAKKEYRLLEKQFRLHFGRAQKQAGNTAENLVKELEKRLDNSVFRLGFAASRDQARQMINHGHIDVNQRKVTIPSFQLKVGDVVSLRPKSARLKRGQELPERLKRQQIPGWLNLNIEELSGKVTSEPQTAEIVTNFNTQMIVEFYSR